MVLLVKLLLLLLPLLAAGRRDAVGCCDAER